MGDRSVVRVVLGLLGIACLSGCVRSIDSGHAGVLWTMTGGTQPEVYGEGVHLVAPWNRLTAYDVRTHRTARRCWASLPTTDCPSPSRLPSAIDRCAKGWPACT